MNDKPAIFLYTGDLWKDISFRLCGWQAQNLWLRLLMLLHDNVPRGIFRSENGTPYTDEQLAALCNMPIADFRVLREELESNNVFSRIAGAIANRRMVREAELHENKVKGGRLGAKSRWQKHSKALADSDGKPIVTTPTYSSSSSSSSSSSDKEKIPLATQVEFEQFWKAYPRKVGGKKNACRAWIKAKDRPSLEVILAAIEKAKLSEQWKKDNGQFIPYPATWLNQGRWADETPPQPPKKWIPLT